MRWFMRFLSIAIILMLFSSTGCIELNSKEHFVTRSGSDMQKVCGCDGHESCSTMTNCGICCTPESCKCKQITSIK